MQLVLGPDEALVLFEWLSRCEESGSYEFIDGAEGHVLSRILGRLESMLAEPFRADYSDLVEAARNRIRAEYGE
jgi:hypothetical protein